MSTTNTTEKPQQIYQIKVTLLGTDPPIWRRLLVPADLTLEQLHNVLQIAMGWEDCHMHEFRIGHQRYGTPDPMERAFGGSPASERTARLFNVLDRAGTKAVYTYDLGDSWSIESRSRTAWRLNQSALTRRAWRVNVTDRPKTAAAYLGSTICWRRSAIQSMRNTKSCWTGSAAASMRTLSRSTTSTGG